MSKDFTLIFGTYTFSNQTFEPLGHVFKQDTPVVDIQRYNGGIALDGYQTPRKIRIKGQLFNNDEDTLHQEANIMVRALRNNGAEAQLQYRSDRYVNCKLDTNGVGLSYERGLYEHVITVDINMVAQKPYAESATLRTVTNTINNESVAIAVTNSGTRPTTPYFQFIGGASFTNNLRVDVPANSHYFNFAGPVLNGQTLIIDCSLGCVLLQSGAAFVNAISYFSGNLFLEVPESGSQTVVLNGATLTYTINSRDRYDF